MHSLTARRTGFMAYPRILRSLPTDKRPPLGLPPGQIVFRIRYKISIFGPPPTFFLLTLPTRSLLSTISAAVDCLQTLSGPPNSLSFVSNHQPLFERHSLELVPRNFPKQSHSSWLMLNVDDGRQPFFFTPSIQSIRSIKWR